MFEMCMFVYRARTYACICMFVCVCVCVCVCLQGFQRFHKIGHQLSSRTRPASYSAFKTIVYSILHKSSTLVSSVTTCISG